MTSQEESKEKPLEKDKEKEKEQSTTPQKKIIDKKTEEQIRRNQIEENNKKFDNKLMKYFGNEFFERRLEIPPKRSIFDPHEMDEEFDKIIPKNKILRNLIHFEKKMDEKIYKTRLDIQEQLLRPKNMIKATLRTHICAFLKDDENTDETNFILNIKGKIIDQEEKKFRKFSHYFQKIQIKFEEDIYPDIEWENPFYTQINQFGNSNTTQVNNMNNSVGMNINQSGQNDNKLNINNSININSCNSFVSANSVNLTKDKETDIDGFSIKRPAKEDNMKIKILFYLAYHIQEFILSPKLSELLGIARGTRPQILYHLWQYIKLNSLQDNENPKIVINNKQLFQIFNCEKMEISSLTSRLSDHLKIPPPIEIEFPVHELSEEYSKNQILKDIHLTIDDPYCYSLLGFLSNANEESLLFPKRFFTSTNPGSGDYGVNNFGKYLEKINEIEKQYSSYLNIMKRHKYYYDFFDAYEKDPILFIDNFMIQQNELIKKISDQTTSIVRADYSSSQYYKDYEEVVRDNVEKYLNKKRQPPK